MIIVSDINNVELCGVLFIDLHEASPKSATKKKKSYSSGDFFEVSAVEVSEDIHNSRLYYTPFEGSSILLLCVFVQRRISE